MMIKNLILMVVAILSLAPHCAYGQTVNPVFANTESGGRYVPKLTVSPNGTIVLTYAVREGTLARYYVSVSTDGGRMFSAPKPIDTAPFGAAILQRQPYVVMDAQNTMHILFERSIGGSERGLFHQTSSNNGATWTTPVRVSAKPPARPQDFASIALAPDGRTIYVSFISLLAEGSDGYTHIFVVRSTNGGATWSEEKRVDSFPVGGCCECCNQNILVMPSGEVVVAFRSNINNRRDIHVTRSNDGGSTFTTPLLVQAEPWFINGCPGTGPSITCDSTSTLHVTWRDARNTNFPTSCYYARIPVGTTNTPENVLVNPPLGTDGEYPIVASNPEGSSVGIAWYSSEGVFYTDKSILPKSTMLSNQAIENPGVHIVWHGTGYLVVWQEKRGHVADLMSVRTVLTTSVQTPRLEGDDAWNILGTYDLRGGTIDSNLLGPTMFIESRNGKIRARKVYRIQ